MKQRPFLLLLLALTVLVGLSVLGRGVEFLTEIWWYKAVGFEGAFWTRLIWQAIAWISLFSLYVLVLWGNYWLAMRLTRHRVFRVLLESRYLWAYAKTLPHYVAFTTIGLIALAAAGAGATYWETIVKYFNPSEFGLADPIYQQDISFYLFSLPFYQKAQGWLLGLLFWAILIVVTVYSLKGEISVARGWQYLLIGRAKTHLSILIAIVALLIAAGTWLGQYDLLYSPSGVVFGAGYTDVHARLLAHRAVTAVAAMVAFAFVFSINRKDLTLPIYSVRALGGGVDLGVWAAALVSAAVPSSPLTS